MKNNKKLTFKILGSVTILWCLYLVTWPVDIEPLAWHPLPAPALEGQYSPNHRLAGIERLELNGSEGPEDVAIDSQGRIYGGLQDGRIIRFEKQGKIPEIFADTGGRPLGLHFDQHGNLIVADAYKGLLSITPNAEIEVLSTESEGVAFRFTDDLDIAEDGTIYFSDASFKYNQAEYEKDALVHQPYGRLLSYNPKTKRTETLLRDLYFANGIAVSPDQSFVLINETWNYRVLRYWLKGDKKGQHDVFIDNLPGFPDGISSNGEGLFWLALASPRNPMLDRLAPYPWLRKVVHRLPKLLHPAPIKYAFVLGLDQNGKVIHNLQEPSGKPFSLITSVQAHNQYLYFGSLEEKAIGRIQLP
jgi:sugar lactone lactonase YvrE